MMKYLIIFLVILAIYLIYNYWTKNVKANKDSAYGIHKNKHIDIKDTKRKQDDLYNIEKKKKQEELDAILDKINKRGIGSLTSKEKNILDNQAKTGK